MPTNSTRSSINVTNLCASLKSLRSTMMIILITVSAMLSSLSSHAQFAVTTNGGSGLNPTYPSLSAAITALNAATITSPVIITCPTGTETSPAGGYSITATGTAVNTIIIQGNGAANSVITAPNPAGTAGALNDAIFKVIGGDYISITGFAMNENAANTTTAAASNNMVEWGVAVLYASATNGAQNVTIQNNSITLNKTYQNSFGIYSNSTHTATAATTSASATGATGGNHNLKVYTNNISNVNNGIVVVGPTAVADYLTGLDIGGANAGTGNTITDYGTTGTFSAYANVSGTVNGILARNTADLNISYNSITSSNGAVTVGTLNGIQIPAFSATPTATFTVNINNNNISLRSGLIAGAINGINYPSGSASPTSTLNINNNNFHTSGHTVAGTAAIIFILNASTHQTVNINSNTFTNLTVNTTGSVTLISNNYTRLLNTVTNVNNNSIVTGFSKTGAGGTVTLYNSNLSTVAANNVSETNSGNNFSNITLTGATTFAGWVSTDGTTTSPFGTTKIVTNNTFTNITGGSSAVTVLSVAYSNTASPSTVSGNTISNITGTGAISGIVSVTASQNIFNNTINGLSTTGAALVRGIGITGGAVQNVYANTICNLSADNATGTVEAIGVTATTASAVVNIYNNRIADLRTPSANAVNPLSGINISTATATVTANVYYNSIYLNASSTGSVFGSSAITANTGPTVNLRNNIFINVSTPNNTTGFTVAYRRSLTTLTSYAATSNNNIFYAGTPGSTRLIYYDGTNSDQTINAFRARVTPRDNASYSENSPFLSTTCGNANFLKINTATPTFAEGLGSAIAGITTDFENDTRNASTPDIGADEFTGTQVAIVNINSLSINPTGNQCVAAARTVTANITIGANPTTSVTLNYSFNGGAPVAVTMTGGNNTAGATSDWTGTIPISTPVNATVTWSVTAIDPLITKNTVGTSYHDEPLFGASASITGTPNPVCAGSPIALTAHVLSAGGTVTLGAGATTSTTYSGPFYSLWNNKHFQMLVKSSELTAAGLGAGSITALTFYSTVIDGVDLNLDFSIKMTNTSATDMTAFVSGGFVQVYSIATFAPVVGANLINFSTPFTWDGTSNVVVEVCFGNSSNTNTLSNTGVMDATSYVSTRIEYNTSTTGGPISGAGICASGNNNVTYSTRPHISFTGVAESTLANYVWNDGSSNVGTGNPFSPSPVVNTSYTVTATDVNGCSVTSSPYAVATTAGPNPPNGNNSTQCGTGVPGAFVTSGGGGAGFKWYSAQLGGTLLQNGGPLYTGTISSTTTFWVSESNGTCESLRTAVVATVTAADPIDANVSNNNPCLNTSIQLTATNTGSTPVNNYTYTWTANPAGGSGIPTSVTGSLVFITPTAAGTYTYTVSGVDGDCANTDQVIIVVKSLPVINSVTANPTAVCAGVSSTLTGFIGSPPGTSTIGTQTATLNTTGSVYRTGAGNAFQVKSQFLVSAAELTTAGMTAGSNINSLGFTTTTTTGTNSNMEIYIGHTNAALLTTTFLTSSMQLVYSVASFTPVPNSINTHTFSSSFIWDGVSNLVIETRHVNQAALGTSTCATFNPGFVSNLQVATATGFATATGTTSATRPLMTFNFGNNATGNYTWQWNPGALSGSTVTVTPLGTTTYTASATDPVTTCAGTATVTVTVHDLPPAPSGSNSEQCGNAIPGISVSSNSLAPTPVFKWYDAPTGGILKQTGTSTTYLSLVAVTSTFYVAEISSFGCEGPRVDVTVTVAEPDDIIVNASDNSICIGQSSDISSSYTPDFNAYAVFELTATGGAASGITGTVTLTTNATGSDPYTVTPTATGTYTYTITAIDPDKGCITLNTVVISVVSLPAISTATANPSTICAGASTVLTATSGSGGPGTAPVVAATGNTQSGSPFRAGNATPARTQLLYTAAELTTAGFTAGNFTAIGFNFTTASGGTLPSFTIRMGNTAATALTTTLQTTPTTLVYGPISLNPPTVTGVFTITFQTPFNWDGTSNLLIDFCHELPNPSAVSGQVASTTAASNMTCYNLATGACTATTGTVQTIRVVPILSGQMGINNTSSYNWTWNPGNINSGTTGVATVSPTTTTSYTATASDPVSGCSVSSSSVTVTVNQLPAAPGTNSPVTRCGAGSVTLTATGSGGALHWYNVATGGTSLFTGTSYTTNIVSGTSFWVAETSAQGCEGPRSEVQVISTAPPTLAITPSGPITFCNGGSVILDAGVNSHPSYINFNWSPTAGLAPTSGAVVTASPNDTTVYTLTADDGVGGLEGCASVATITITVNPNPLISAVTATPATICAGQSTQLEGTSLVGSPLTAKIGTGTTGFTGAGNPYWRLNSADASKFQFLYKAADMINAGFSAGPINGIIFRVTTDPVTSASFYNDYKISMGHTSATALTAAWQTGLQQVMNPIDHVPVTGDNQYNFDVPFTWDGVSNVVVQVCYDNDPDGTCTTCTGANLAVEQTTAIGYQASSYFYHVGTTAGRNICDTTAAASLQGHLVNITFVRGFSNNTSLYNWQWNPGAISGAVTTVSPTATTTYTLTATNPTTSCTSSSPITVNVNPVAAAPVTNDPVTRCGPGSVTLTATNTGGTMNWYNVATGGTSLHTGDSYTTNVLGNTIFYVAETYVTGCEGPRSAVNVTVTSSAPLVITPSGSTSICLGNSISLDAASASDPSYINFAWSANPGATGGLSSTSGATVTATPTTVATYTYTVNADDGGGCANTASITITINPNPVITAATATPAAICAGGSSTLAGQSTTLVSNNATLTGTPTTTLNTTGSVYRTGASSGFQVKAQFLVRASELTGAGYTAGNISSIGFTTTTTTGTNSDMEIRIGHTAATVLTTTFLTDPMTTVFTAATFTPLANQLNTHVFQTAFVWDGVSNIVIEERHVNQPALGTSTCVTFNFGYTANVQVATATGFTATTGTTSASRPIMTLAGVSGSNQTGNYNWVWNPGAINAGTTGTTTVNPVTTTTYTVTATNPITGCFTNSSPVTVTVGPVTANATATPSTPVCVGTSVTLNAGAAGGPPLSYSWSNGVSVVGTTASITVSPATTTTYTVTVTDGCSNTTTSSVTVNINPLPTASIQEGPGPINICNPSSQVLTAVTDAGSAAYQWTLNGTNITLNGTGPTYTVSGLSTGTYRVIVTNTTTTCVSPVSTGVVVTVNPTPSAVSITPTSATICAGSPQLLTASGGTIGGTGSGVITGTSPTTSASYPSPFYRLYEGSKKQYIIKASELTTMGMSAGSNMSSISFNVTTLSRTTNINQDGFNIKIGGTTQADLATAFVGGLTTVYGPVVYNPVAGANVFNFSSPFIWDGTSNVVVEVCFDNDPGNTCELSTPVCWSNAATVSVATAPFANAMRQINADNTIAIPRADICGLASTANTTQILTLRPVMTFAFTTVVPTSFSWLPATELSPTSGGVVTASPTVTRTYTATATSVAGCSNAATVTITVNARPTAAISGSGAFCQGAANTSTNLTVNFTGTAPWNYTYTTNGGSPVSGTTSSNPLTITVSPGSASPALFTYEISALSDANCASVAGDLSGSGTVTINPLAASPTAVVSVQPTCAVGTGTITVTAPLGTGNSYTLDGTTTISWPTVSFTGVAPGPHTITVANSFGCSAPASTSVTVDPQPFIPGTPVVTGTVNVCPYIGTTTQLTYHATATGNGTQVFNWVIPTTNVTIVSGQGTADLTVTFQNGFAAQANKQLRLTVTNQCGTSSMTIYYLLAQFPNTPNPITGPTNVCALIGTATTATYTTNKAAGALTYNWSTPANTVVSHPNGAGVNDTTIVVTFNTGFTGGNISVVAENLCGPSGTRTLTIVNTPPSTPGLISGPTNGCPHVAPGGTAATYSITPVPFATSYTWTTPAGSVVTHPNGAGANDYTITVLYPVGFASGSITVSATNGCGTGGVRSLSVTKLNPATPSVIDVIQTHFCGEAGGRKYTYTLASMPANATSVLWTVPAGATFINLSTISIEVTYPDVAVNGVVTAQATSNCAVSTIRSTTVKLPACPPPGFAAGKGETINPAPIAKAMEVKIFPNPTVSDFKLQVLTSGSEEITIRVMDNLGRVYKSFKMMPYQTIALGAELKAGSYLIEVRQGSEVKTSKVIKF